MPYRAVIGKQMNEQKKHTNHGKPADENNTLEVRKDGVQWVDYTPNLAPPGSWVNGSSGCRVGRKGGSQARGTSQPADCCGFLPPVC